MEKIKWKLEDAIEIVRELEIRAATCGFHTALTGSVLQKGESDEDLDIIFYPRKTERHKDIVALIDGLRAQGLTQWVLRDHTLMFDQKIVYSTKYKGVHSKHHDKRVDVFILI